MPQFDPADANLLIVDDDATICRLLVLAAQEHGWRPAVASGAHEALEMLGPKIKAVVLDHQMPQMTGSEVLERIMVQRPGLPVIMLTSLNDAQTAIRAVRAGAVDYLTKPFEIKHLFELLRNTRRLEVAPAPEASPAASSSRKPSVGTSSPMVRKLLRQIERSAKLDSTILLTGESGTGKTFFAREIHRLSPRAGQDFVTVSCPALPSQLLESELFGHERGAFTGATNSRAGRFEQATRGTLFLDEIGDLPPELQPKLLNVLQDREFFRVGGNKMLRSEARLIAATNVDLQERVAQGAFREDLYYRLNIIELVIPPLRERREDLPALVSHILARIAASRGVEGWRLSPAAFKAIEAYEWPGNLRQLENVLERSTAFTDETLLELEDVLPLLEARRDAAAAKPATTLQEAGRATFMEAYIRSGKNKARTARALGISERSIYNLVARYGIK